MNKDSIPQAKHGPNVTKLILRYAARESIPAGGGVADGLRFFTDAEHRQQVLEKSEAAVMQFIAAIKAAPENPYPDDEAIAAEVLARLPQKQTPNRHRHPPKSRPM
jgi:hypothetical protein